jgi:hypothetical protein
MTVKLKFEMLGAILSVLSMIRMSAAPGLDLRRLRMRLLWHLSGGE